MKNNNSKSILKDSKNAALNELRIKLVSDFNEVLQNFGKDSNKSRRTIKKETKSFFKRISKEIKVIKVSVVTSGATEVSASLVVPSTSASSTTVRPKRIRAKVDTSTVQAKTKASKAPVSKTKEVKN
jgi:ElaB/YqjD/DUF883 family membrane-anchored ribosome-binding protein